MDNVAVKPSLTSTTGAMIGQQGDDTKISCQGGCSAVITAKVSDLHKTGIVGNAKFKLYLYSALALKKVCGLKQRCHGSFVFDLHSSDVLG